MNYEISKEAQIDLDRAVCYFKLINKDDEFLNDFIDNLRLIKKIPKAFQIRYRTVRIVNFNNFNHSIHYSISDARILILRILNQKQDF